MKLLRSTFLLLSVLLLTTSCASFRELPKDYSRIVEKRSKAASDRTVIVFLVDGLQVETLKQELVAGNIPNLSSFFIGSKQEMYIARTEFPSLTFTGIGGLLTETPVNKNGLFGNKVLKENEVINLEQPQNYRELSRRMKNQNIFARLRAKGHKTVSLSYSFYADADVHSDIVDPQAALAILNEDYDFLDRKTLDSLSLLLTQNIPETWPDFIFVHLVGVDFLTHRFGPQSLNVPKYLKKLDLQLKPIFELLNLSEINKQRKVMSLLTSDHGFDQNISSRVELTQLLGPQAKQMTIFNEGRYAGLYFPKDWSATQRTEYMQKISQDSAIEIVAYQNDNRVSILSIGRETEFTYSKSPCQQGDYAISIQHLRPRNLKSIMNPATCPEKLDAKINYLFHPYFIANLSHYFQAESHPEALIIPRPGISFHRGTLGQHGGPTRQEIFVPLLIHNGTLTDLKRNSPLWQLLHFL